MHKKQAWKVFRSKRSNLLNNFYGDNKWYLKITSSFLPISDLQTELARKGHETQEEQKRMTELVEKLQSQLSQNECDLKSRETQLRRQQVKSSR